MARLAGPHRKDGRPFDELPKLTNVGEIATRALPGRQAYDLFKLVEPGRVLRLRFDANALLDGEKDIPGLFHQADVERPDARSTWCHRESASCRHDKDRHDEPNISQVRRPISKWSPSMRRSARPCALLKRTSTRAITLNMIVPSDLPAVPIDAVSFQQVIHNLVRNAAVACSF